MKLSSDQIEALLQAGAAAPSPANLQAWEVKVLDSKFELRLDEERATTFLDVGKYAATFALGAFAENVVQAARAMHLEPQVEVQPDATGSVHAIFTFTDKTETLATSESDLSPFIFSRSTNRKLGDGKLISKETIAILKGELQDADLFIELAAVSSAPKKQIFEEALGKADAIRLLNSTARNEMFREVCWSDEEAKASRDRVALNTLELPAPIIFSMRLMRRFPWLLKLMPRSQVEKMFLPQLNATSHLCCISMQGPYTPMSMFKTGRAAQRFWLRATQLGLSVHPWAILPYLMMRNELLAGEGFSSLERAILGKAKKELVEVCDFSPQAVPVFIFRLFQGAPPSARALRRPSKSFMSE